MKANITIYDYGEAIKNKHCGNFMVNDITGVLLKLKKPVKIVCINDYYNETQEQKKEIIQSVISLLNNKEDWVICTTAYVSTTEFPEEEYHISERGATEQNKKLIPIDEILERESKLLEDLDFIDINDYVKYEFKKAYIFSNGIGREIADFLKN